MSTGARIPAKQTMPNDLPNNLFFDLVKSDDVEAAFDIEKQGKLSDGEFDLCPDFALPPVFPPDEAATLQALRCDNIM